MSDEISPDILYNNLISTLSSLDSFRVDPGRIQPASGWELAAGRFGEIEKATLNNVVAVKRLRPSGDWVARLRVTSALTRHIKTWSDLKHANLVPLEGFSCNASQLDCLWIVTSWQSHGNLCQYVSRLKPDDTKRLKLALDAANGLKYLHELSPALCHGDIKPENILVNGNGNAMLCDFGLAQIFQDVPPVLGKGEVTYYTLRYASPEAVTQNGPRPSVEADVWAWGCVLFVVMTDSLPHAGTYGQGIIRNLMQHQLPADLGALASSLPEVVSDILEECWRPAAAARPPMHWCCDMLQRIVRPHKPIAPKNLRRESASESTSPTAPSAGGSSQMTADNITATHHRLKIRDLNDAHTVFQAVRQGCLPLIRKRLSSEEQAFLRTGHVFVWAEGECSFERWMDGHSWSPSRIRGPFLKYDEVDEEADPPQRGKKATEPPPGSEKKDPRARKKNLPVLPNGLVKMTYSATLQDSLSKAQKWHLVTYIKKDDDAATLAQIRVVADDPVLKDVAVPEGTFKSSMAYSYTSYKTNRGEVDAPVAGPSNRSRAASFSQYPPRPVLPSPPRSGSGSSFPTVPSQDPPVMTSSYPYLNVNLPIASAPAAPPLDHLSRRDSLQLDNLSPRTLPSLPPWPPRSPTSPISPGYSSHDEAAKAALENRRHSIASSYVPTGPQPEDVTLRPMSASPSDRGLALPPITDLIHSLQNLRGASMDGVPMERDESPTRSESGDVVMVDFSPPWTRRG